MAKNGIKWQVPWRGGAELFCDRARASESASLRAPTAQTRGGARRSAVGSVGGRSGEVEGGDGGACGTVGGCGAGGFGGERGGVRRAGFIGGAVELFSPGEG